MKLATRLIHGAHAIDPATGALSVPIYQISTFAQKSVDHFGKYDYARSGNPTREALEDTIAALEGGALACAFASGMAAISTTLLLFSPGDHLVVCDDVYGGAYRVLTAIFTRWGLDGHLCRCHRPGGHRGGDHAGDEGASTWRPPPTRC